MTPSRQEIDHATSSSRLVYFTNHDILNCVKQQWDWSTGRPVRDRSPSRNRVKWTCGKARTERPVLFWKLQKSCWLKKPKSKKPNKKEDHEQVRGRPRVIPTYRNGCKKFRENLVDDRVPEHRDSRASSSHGLSLEPARSADLGKHSVKTHFPKDRNCEICQRTNITRAPCRRRIGRVVPRAENYGDLITADHKVLSEGCESRNNHRYALVVQDLATQWIQSYPCKTKTAQETQRSLQKFLEPERKP